LAFDTNSHLLSTDKCAGAVVVRYGIKRLKKAKRWKKVKKFEFGKLE
jgi:hypothetical protein